MANEKLFHVAVKGLVVNKQGNLLVFEADNSKFLTPDPAHGDLVGGRIEIGQDPQEALLREIQEEAGITDVSGIKFLTAVVSPMQIPINSAEKVGLLLMIFEVHIPEDAEIVISEEHTKFEWLTPVEAAAALEFKFGKEFSSALRGGGVDGLRSL